MSLVSPLYAKARSGFDLESEVARAYHERNTIVMSIDDPHLTPWERQMLINMGNRIFGPREGGQDEQAHQAHR